MKESGEFLPPEDVFHQNLHTALEAVAQARSTPHQIFASVDWPQESPTIERVQLCEIVEAKKLPGVSYSQAGPPLAAYKLNYLIHSSQDHYLDPEQGEATVSYFNPRFLLELDNFRGTPDVVSGLFKPFLEHNRCTTEAEQHDFLKTIVATDTIGQPSTNTLLVKLRTNITKDYSPAGIEHYCKVVEGIDTSLLGPMSALDFSEAATKLLVREFIPTPNDQNHVYLPKEQVEQSILTLEKHGLLSDPDFITSPFTRQSFAFSQILHSRLRSEKRGATLEKMGKDPFIFAQEYITNILGICAGDPTRHSPNTKIIISHLGIGEGRVSQINLRKVVALGNGIHASTNDASSEGKRQPSRSIESLEGAGSAFLAILSATRSTDPGTELLQKAADTIHASIVNLLVKPAVAHEIDRKVITIKQVVEDYAEKASSGELDYIIYRLQTGTAYDKIAKEYTSFKRKYPNGVFGASDPSTRGVRS